MKPTLAAASLFAVLLVSPALAEPQVFDCVAEPAQRVAIGSPVTGLLASVRVGRGDEVKRGGELARLESTVEEANVALATAQANARESLESQRTRLELAEANLDRSLKLMNSGAVTQSKIDELQAIVAISRRDLITEELRLRLAAIELERQKSLLARQSIKSAIDGVVVEQSLRAGEFVRQDSAIMTIAQTDPLHVEAYVPTTWAIRSSTRPMTTHHPTFRQKSCSRGSNPDVPLKHELGEFETLLSNRKAREVLGFRSQHS